MTSSSLKPRVRAMFVDARERRESVVTGLLTKGHAKRTRLGFVMRAETEKLDVLFEELDETSPLADRVDRCRGIDVAVVVAGRATGQAADTLRMLHACGARTAVAIFEHDEASARDLRENLGRHLLLGTAFEADEVPIVTLAGSANALAAHDAAALFAAIDEVAVPRADDAFLVSGANASGTTAVTSRLVRGSLAPPRGQGSLLVQPGRFVDVTFGTGGGRAGDIVALDLDDQEVPSPFLLAHRPLDFVDCIRVDIARPLIEGEHVSVFGGDHGCVDGTVRGGRIDLAGPIAMFDDRVGVLRHLGYAQIGSCLATRA